MGVEVVTLWHLPGKSGPQLPSIAELHTSPAGVRIYVSCYDAVADAPTREQALAIAYEMGGQR